MLSPKQVASLRRTKPEGRNRVSLAIELAGVTQVQIAESTGFTQSYISRIQNGRYDDLPGETMRTLATYFGCLMEDLFPAREEMSA